MQYLQLGNTSVKVSKICLGTMTFGEQNSENEAHEQLDYSIDQGINIIDTAELYAVPARAETYGLTEKYIGSWIKSRKNRDKFILATKIAGYSPDFTHIRGGSRFNAEHISKAIEGSLSRLQTDYIDLYQLHWPERNTNYFGRLGYRHRSNDEWKDNFAEVLGILNEFVKQGKIRFIGISNETPWGTSRYLKVTDELGSPRVVSIQNPYSLVNRSFEVGLAEISIRENLSMLAYSPLAFGLLTGKYFQTTQPKDARLNLFPKLSRYNNEYARAVAKKYVDLAYEYNLSPAQMALAYVNSRDFITCNIIGATTMEQLKENIASIHVSLSDEILEKIEAIHISQPNPAP